MSKIKDLTGNVYNKLTVLYDTGERSKCRQVYWMCKCNCGNLTKVRANGLKLGSVKSCGKCSTNTFYEHEDGYMVGITSNGNEFYFDKKYFEKIKEYNWCLNDQGYIIARIKGIFKTNRNIRMHHLIKPISLKELEVDHINRIRHDNREKNLRVATHQQNMRNQSKTHKPTSSKYKGVSFHKQCNKWRAYIRHDGKQITLGLFSSEEEAYDAYCKKSSEIFGQFAAK